MNAQQIAAQGRYGDNTLVHASADEVKGLDALSRSIYGQKLPRNPQTGLPEAFLFAPFLAPLMAGSIPALAGMGAIGTGLLAGGLGAAEAAARGMDDPLQQGLLAGLTGGAAAGIGNALSAAGGATQAGTQTALQGGAGANTLVGGAGADVLAGTTGNLTSLADISSGAYKAGLGAAQPTTQAAMQAAPTAFAPNPAMMAAEAAAPKTGLAGIGQQFSQMGRGAKALMQPGAFQEGGVGQTFMKQAKVPAIAGATGLMGQSALAEEQAMRDAEEERKRRGEEARAKSMGYISDIAARNPYSMAGQAYYNPFQFAEGGIVNLANGGSVAPPGVVGYDENGNRIYAYHPLFDSPSFSGRYFNPYDSGGGHWNIPDDIAADIYSTAPYVGYTVPTSGAAPTISSPTSPSLLSSSGPSGPAPSQDPKYQAFMRELQRGAGNIAAGQRSGYVGGGTKPIPAAGKKEELAGGGYLGGGAVPGDGMSDSVPAAIDGNTPAALSSGEFVVTSDAVSHLGNGSSEAGAQELYAMVDRIRKARTGTTEQAPRINPREMLPA